MVNLSVARYLGLRLRRSRLAWIAPGLLIGLPLFMATAGGVIASAASGIRPEEVRIAVAATIMVVLPLLELGIAGYFGFWLLAAELENDEFHAMRLAVPSVRHMILLVWLFGVKIVIALTALLVVVVSISYYALEGTFDATILGTVAMLLTPATLTALAVGMLVGRFNPSDNGAVLAVVLSLAAVPLTAAVPMPSEALELALFFMMPFALIPPCLIAYRSLE